MSTDPTILVPIRYPLTPHTTHTLERANHLAKKYDTVEFIVLHVNLYQAGDRTREGDIRRQVTPFFPDYEPQIITRRGFLVEEVISNEVDQHEVDFVVLGKNQKSPWRRLLSRVVGNQPAIASYLQGQTDAAVEVVG